MNPPSESSPSLSWYCFRAQPKRERIAVESLRREVGLEAFAPRIRFFKKTRTGKKRFVEALFPGYVFVRCDLNEHLRHACSRRGVMGVVKYGPRIPQVPEGLLASIRSEYQEAEEDLIDLPPEELSAGCQVDIVSGPFASMKAVVTHYLPAKDRVKILVDLLGRELAIDVAGSDVMKVV